MFFAWPVAEVRHTLHAEVPNIQSGATAPPAFELSLAPVEQVSFPTPPERRHPNSFAGFVALPDLRGGSLLQVSLSDEAWIDVVQNGRGLKSAGSTGKRGCEGLRKSVRFSLPASAASLVLQISGAEKNKIRVDIRTVQ